ncbi:MAG: sulfatase-like hydrolase/transferase, partial [Deltaproteobacteria bacterium]|nr:sulfatase-like hydrolase/transferase [Deltaproteobacteria bacterium]
PPLARVVPPDHAYDVVLIVVDTLRADHLSSWGYPRPTSPNIDALAARGIRFSQARSQAAWTTASVGSLMTSRYPTSLGIEEERSALPEDFPTLAESLREAAGLVEHLTELGYVE